MMKKINWDFLRRDHQRGSSTGAAVALESSSSSQLGHRWSSESKLQGSKSDSVCHMTDISNHKPSRLSFSDLLLRRAPNEQPRPGILDSLKRKFKLARSERSRLRQASKRHSFSIIEEGSTVETSEGLPKSQTLPAVQLACRLCPSPASRGSCCDVHHTSNGEDGGEKQVVPVAASNNNLAWELFKLVKYGWYWGRMTRGEAERKLAEQDDGAFLVRDSSDDCHLLSLSFRSYGRTLHTRIEHTNGYFSFYAYPEAEQHRSVGQLIEHLMDTSRSGIFCYSRSRSPGSPSYPVRLTKPVSRFSEVLPLQHMCRFVIRQYVRMDHIENLPLPESLKSFIVRGNS